MSDTPEIIECPHCQGKLRLPKLSSSRTIQCGHCKQPFEYHPEGIADATIVDSIQTAESIQTKSTASLGDDSNTLVGITAVLLGALIAWFFAGMPRMDGISDTASWASITFSWQMLKLVFVSVIASIVFVLLLGFVLGMFFSKYESMIHNLMFGIILAVPLGLAAAPLLAWVGSGSEWRTALATQLVGPRDADELQTGRQKNSDRAQQDKAQMNTANAKSNSGSTDNNNSGSKVLSNSNGKALTNRPAVEPFASCYDLWENVTYDVDSYTGHKSYPFSKAEAIEKQYPACFSRSTKTSYWIFPRFELGPKAAAARGQICLDLARNYYFKVLDEKQSKRTFTTDASINAAFVSAYRSATGVYCFKPTGEPLFSMDNSFRPQPFDRESCNSTAKGYVARAEPQEKIHALCFNSDGSPIFDLALFADEEGRKNALYAECARNFEPYAKTFLEVWGQDEPDSLEELWTSTLGNLDVFERGNKHCFKQVAGQTTALFPLTGPYARDYRIRAYYHQ